MQRLKAISDEEYAACNPLNRRLVEEYLANSTELSDRTLDTYQSNLRIWIVWIKNHLNNKNITEIKPREYLTFQNWLVSMGHSSSDIGTKRSSISSLNNYIEVYYLDEYPNYRSCINSSIKKPEKVYVHEKNPPSREEVEMMCKKLEESDRWDKYQLICYLKFVFETGCRRAETAQIMKSIADAEKVNHEITVRDSVTGDPVKRISSYYLTDKIRCKGRGKTGKIRQLKFSDYSMQWIKKWLEVRGEDDIPSLFIAKYHGEYRAANPYTFNSWAEHFTALLGRRFHPHTLRSAIASDIVVAQGKNIEVAQALLGHASSEVTRGYVVGVDEESDADELFI